MVPGCVEAGDLSVRQEPLVIPVDQLTTLIDHPQRVVRPGRIQPVVATPVVGASVAARRGLRRGSSSRGFSGSVVERVGDGFELVGAPAGQVGALGEVLAQQPVGVLVGAALPGAVRVGEVDRDAGVDRELRVLRPSPCRGPRSAIGAAARAACVIVAAIASFIAIGAVAGQRGPVLHARHRARSPSTRGRCSSIVNRVVRSTSVPIADRSQPDDQVAFPVPGDGAVRRPRRAVR